jgi:hypothetical protein
MRAIIAAAGGQSKWNEHLGVPSHLCPLTRHGNQPLVHRTIEQVRGYTPDVTITTPDDDRYNSVAPMCVRSVVTGEHPSEYAATRHLWNEDGRTVLLLGDVFFSEQAMLQIMFDTRRQYMVYGRYRKSAITGTPYGEIFAASWWPEEHERLDRTIKMVHDVRASGAVTRPPGWMILRAYQGTPLNRHLVLSDWFTEIDDETDDIDFPADYDRHPATRSA